MNEGSKRNEKIGDQLTSGLPSSLRSNSSLKASSEETCSKPFPGYNIVRMCCKGVWQITSMIFSIKYELAMLTRDADTISNAITVQPPVLWSSAWPFEPRFPWVVRRVASFTLPEAKQVLHCPRCRAYRKMCRSKKGKRNGRDEKVFLFEFSGYLCENPFLRVILTFELFD